MTTTAATAQSKTVQSETVQSKTVQSKTVQSKTVQSKTVQSKTVQINRIYIRATPQAIWDAIITPEWTEKYGYGGRVEYDLRPGGRFRSVADAAMQQAGMPEVVVDGEVIEADPPHRLVQTWRAAWGDEPATRLTYEISGKANGVSCLTVTHDLTGAPNTAAMVGGTVDGAGGGWAEVLSDLKTLLETGSSLSSLGVPGV